jgi:hypothetical protein
VSGTLSTTAGQIGSLQRVINWVGTAWEELQTKHEDWDWMESSILLGGGAAFVSVAGQASYPLGTGAGTVGVLATNFGKWKLGTFRNYNTASGVSGEIFMDDISFASWRDSYMYGAMRTVQTRPVAIAVGPDKSLCLGPPPAAGYTFNADYYRAPTAMMIDTDVPTGLPVEHHMAIVWNAMMMYAGYEAASEVFQRGEQGYDKHMAQLESKYAPTATMAGSLC